MTESNGKALYKTRAKATLVKIGDRLVSSDGRYHDYLAGEWCILEASKQWRAIGEFSRAMFCNADVNTKRKARGRVGKLRTHLRDEFGLVLMVEYNGSYGAATAMKLYDSSSEEDNQLVDAMIEKAVLVGDCKTLEAQKLRQAIKTLRENLHGKDIATAGPSLFDAIPENSPGESHLRME